MRLLALLCCGVVGIALLGCKTDGSLKAARDDWHGDNMKMSTDSGGIRPGQFSSMSPPISAPRSSTPGTPP